MKSLIAIIATVAVGIGATGCTNCCDPCGAPRARPACQAPCAPDRNPCSESSGCPAWPYFTPAQGGGQPVPPSGADLLIQIMDNARARAMASTGIERYHWRLVALVANDCFLYGYAAPNTTCDMHYANLTHALGHSQSPGLNNADLCLQELDHDDPVRTH